MNGGRTRTSDTVPPDRPHQRHGRGPGLAASTPVSVTSTPRPTRPASASTLHAPGQPGGDGGGHVRSGLRADGGPSSGRTGPRCRPKASRSLTVGRRSGINARGAGEYTLFVLGSRAASPVTTSSSHPRDPFFTLSEVEVGDCVEPSPASRWTRRAVLRGRLRRRPPRQVFERIPGASDTDQAAQERCGAIRNERIPPLGGPTGSPTGATASPAWSSAAAATRSRARSSTADHRGRGLRPPLLRWASRRTHQRATALPDEAPDQHEAPLGVEVAGEIADGHAVRPAANRVRAGMVDRGTRSRCRSTTARSGRRAGRGRGP